MLMRSAGLLLSAVLGAGFSGSVAAERDPGGGGFGSVECGQAGGPRCRISARRDQSIPGRTRGPVPRRTGSRESGLAQCSGEPLVPDEACGVGVLANPAGGEGQAASPVEIAQQAAADLVLPDPVIRSSPKPEGLQLVPLPTWLWIDRSAWRPRSRTVSVPGVSVTAMARPVKVSWSMGDGAPVVVCGGAGTPYGERMDPSEPSPDCGHIYERSSAGEPRNSFRVTATITWAISWSGGGESGTLPPLTSTASTAFRVAEIQALTSLAGG